MTTYLLLETQEGFEVLHRNILRKRFKNSSREQQCKCEITMQASKDSAVTKLFMQTINHRSILVPKKGVQSLK